MLLDVSPCARPLARARVRDGGGKEDSPTGRYAQPLPCEAQRGQAVTDGLIPAALFAGRRRASLQADAGRCARLPFLMSPPNPPSPPPLPSGALASLRQASQGHLLRWECAPSSAPRSALPAGACGCAGSALSIPLLFISSCACACPAPFVARLLVVGVRSCGLVVPFGRVALVGLLRRSLRRASGRAPVGLSLRSAHRCLRRFFSATALFCVPRWGLFPLRSSLRRFASPQRWPMRCGRFRF